MTSEPVWLYRGQILVPPDVDVESMHVWFEQQFVPALCCLWSIEVGQIGARIDVENNGQSLKLMFAIRDKDDSSVDEDTALD